MKKQQMYLISSVTDNVGNPAYELQRRDEDGKGGKTIIKTDNFAELLYQLKQDKLTWNI